VKNLIAILLLCLASVFNSCYAENLIVNGSFEEGVGDNFDFWHSDADYENVVDNGVFNSIKIPGRNNVFDIGTRYFDNEIELEYKSNSPLILNDLTIEIVGYSYQNVIIFRILHNIYSADSDTELFSILGEEKSISKLRRNIISDGNNIILPSALDSINRANTEHNYKSSDIKRLQVIIKSATPNKNIVIYGWEKYFLKKYKEPSTVSINDSNLKLFDIEDTRKTFNQYPNLIFTEFASSKGYKHLKLISTKDKSSVASQQLRVEPNLKHYLTIDSKVLTGRMRPYYEILDIDTQEIIFSNSVDVDFSQRVWVRSGGSFVSKSGNIEVRLFSFPNNVYGKYGVNIEYDNIIIESELSTNNDISHNCLSLVKGNDSEYFSCKLTIDDLLDDEFKKTIFEEKQNTVKIDTYDLIFDEKSFWKSISSNKGIQANDLISGESNMYPALLVHNDREYKVKIRIRGDTATHTFSPTKSWRIKFVEPKYFGKRKSINLIRPESRGIIAENFNYYMARKFDLISLENKFVFLNVNGIPYGVMFEIEHWNEGILEKNQRPAGNIYGEENRVSGKKFGEQSSIIFKKYLIRDHSEWKKYSTDKNNHKKNKQDILFLNRLINNDLYDYFYNVMNVENWINWSVLSVLIGSEHQDSFHNNRLYFDNTIGKFEMVPWDAHTRFTTDKSHALFKPYYIKSISERYNYYMDYLFKDKEIYNIRNKKLWSYLNNSKNIKDDNEYLASLVEKLIPHLSLTRRYDLDFGKEEISTSKFNKRLILMLEEYKEYREKVLELLRTNPMLLNIDIGSDTENNNGEDITRVDLYRDDRRNEISSIDVEIKFKKNIESKELRIYKDNGDGVFDIKNDILMTVASRFGNVVVNDVIASKFYHNKYLSNLPYTIASDMLDDNDNLIANDKKILLKYFSKGPDNYYYINHWPSSAKDTSVVKNILTSIAILPKYSNTTTYFIKTNDSILAEKDIDISVNNSSTGENIVYSKSKSLKKTHYIYYNKNKKAEDRANSIKKGLKVESINFPLYSKKDRKLFLFFDRIMQSEKEFLSRYEFIKKNSTKEKSYIIHPGSYDISDTVIVPSGFELIISPGVRLRFLPGRSLISYGSVIANGTDKNKIYFESSSLNKQWGVLGVINSKSYNFFNYCVFDGGGSDLINGVHLSGMLSMYNSDVNISNSVFKNASKNNGDDALNVKNAFAHIEKSHFIANHKDAIDLDFVDKESEVLGSFFKDNGNDSIDISGSNNIFLRENIIINSGDKGISAGEESYVVVENNKIKNNSYGVVSKDSSIVNIIESSINNNNIGVAAYNKKMIFGGGEVYIHSSNLDSNTRVFGVENIAKEDSGRYKMKRFKSFIGSDSNKHNSTGEVYKFIIASPSKRATSKKKLLKAMLEDKLDDYQFKYAIFSDNYTYLENNE